MNPKVPRTPPRARALTDKGDLRTVEAAVLWRIHSVSGKYPNRWNEFRVFGPVNSRWEPHPEPLGDHAPVGVLYSSLDVVTCFAEVFQTSRVIEASSERALSGWTPTRPLTLLDLTGNWPIRNGASSSLHAAPKSTTRSWARWICAEHPDVDGIYAPSTMTNGHLVVLFSPAAIDSLPDRPDFTRTLDHGGVAPYVTAAADALNFGFRGGYSRVG